MFRRSQLKIFRNALDRLGIRYDQSELPGDAEHFAITRLTIKDQWSPRGHSVEFQFHPDGSFRLWYVRVGQLRINPERSL